eukprot:6005638-Alexandrium_andersonii.AAC.1
MWIDQKSGRAASWSLAIQSSVGHRAQLPGPPQEPEPRSQHHDAVHVREHRSTRIFRMRLRIAKTTDSDWEGIRCPDDQWDMVVQALSQIAAEVVADRQPEPAHREARDAKSSVA